MARKIKTNASETLATEIDAVTSEALVADAATAELEAVVHVLEATEVQEPEAATETPVETPQADASAFVEAMENATGVQIETMTNEVRSSLTDREFFESTKNPDNANIHRTIKKVRGSLDRVWAAKVMVAANQDAAFINRTLMDGSRYNVYAIGKYADLVDALAGSGMQNAINIAITRSLFAFEKAGLEFNGEMAKAAASDKIRVAETVKRHLIRHTVSASTAPTQASSTMQALQTLGVVAIDGSRKNPRYKLLNNPVTARLREVVEKMAA